MVSLGTARRLARVIMPTSIPVKNTNQIHQIRIVAETKEIDPKTKKVEWVKPLVTYLKPGESTDIWVAENRRFSIQELPT
jgi:hypothetical protein